MLKEEEEPLVEETPVPEYKPDLDLSKDDVDRPDPTTMPTHTSERPNWALAPDEPEPSPRREYRRNQDVGRHDQNRSLNREDHRGQQRDRNRGNHAGGGGSDYNSPSREPRDEHHNARNGPARRGRSEEPSYNQPSPSHVNRNDQPRNTSSPMRDNSPGQDHHNANQSHSYNEQPQRLPPAPALSHVNSLNASAPVKDASQPTIDEWQPVHDPWIAKEGNKIESDVRDTKPPPQNVNSYEKPPLLPNKPPIYREDSLNTAAPYTAPPPITSEWQPTHDARTAPNGKIPPISSATHAYAQRDTAPSHFNGHRPSEAAWAGIREIPADSRRGQDEWQPPHDPWASQSPASHSTARGPQRDERRHEPQPPPHLRDHRPSEEAWAGVRKQPDTPDGQQYARSGGSPQYAVVAARGVPQVREPERRNFADTARTAGDGYARNVLDVRAPSLAGVATLAASRAAEMYERSNDNAPAKTDELYWNYAAYSETIDWIAADTTKLVQNKFSPTQNITPSRTPTGSDTASNPDTRSPVPQPDFNSYASPMTSRQQHQEQGLGNGGPRGYSSPFQQQQQQHQQHQQPQHQQQYHYKADDAGPKNFAIGNIRSERDRGSPNALDSGRYSGSPGARGGYGEDVGYRNEPTTNHKERFAQQHGGAEYRGGGYGAGAPRVTSYGNTRFVPPPLEEWGELHGRNGGRR